MNEILHSMAKPIIEKFNTEKIIVFGSWARGSRAGQRCGPPGYHGLHPGAKAGNISSHQEGNEEV